MTAIAASAFKGNKKIKKLVIKKNIKKIGKKALYGTTNLKRITIYGKNLTTIGSKAFTNTPKKAVISIKGVTEKKFKTLRKKLLNAGVSASATIK